MQELLALGVSLTRRAEWLAKVDPLACQMPCIRAG